MSKEIVVNVEERQTRIAIVEDGDLVELYIEDPEHKRTIGNIMLGRIRKVMPSIRAAFVDIGQDSDAFLHFSDVSDNVTSILDFLHASPPRVEDVELPAADEGKKTSGKRRKPSGSKKGGGGGKKGQRRGTSNVKERGKRRSAQKKYHRRSGPRPEAVLKQGQTLLVKVSKEPIANKGSRISTDISLAGRFLVLVPLSSFVAVSKKISSSKERRRLHALAESLLPKGFAVIVRTVAEGRDAKSLDTDLKLLLERWRRLESKLKSKPPAPLLLHEDVDMVSSIIRDLFSSDYDRILIDDQRLYRSIRGYVQAVAPQRADCVQHYTGKKPVFEAEGIRLGAERAFERRIDLAPGGYLFIERTEAMHVVDVNSGRSGRGMTQEQNSLRCNLESARAIARQIRLRDLGGIIVVDFIDLRHDKNRKKVYDEIQKEFKKDRAVTKVLPMSDFGLVQITRQRLRPSITTTFGSANGSGEDRDEVARLREQVRLLEQQQRDLKSAGRRNGSGSSGSASRSGSSAHAGNGKHEEELERLRNKVRHMREAVDSARKEARAARDTAASARKQAEKQAKKQSEQPADLPPAEALVERLEQWVAGYEQRGAARAVTLRVHPFTAAYLHRSLPSHPTRWFMRHLVRVRVEADEAVAPLAFRFVDGRTGEALAEEAAPPAGR